MKSSLGSIVSTDVADRLFNLAKNASAFAPTVNCMVNSSQIADSGGQNPHLNRSRKYEKKD